MRTNTKKFEVLKFIGQHRDGVRSTDVEKFISEVILEKPWSRKSRCGSWSIALYGYGRREGLYSQHCVKVNNRWYLNIATHSVVKQYYIDNGWSDVKVYGTAITNSIKEEQRSDKISASGGGELTMPPLLPPRYVEQIPIPPKKEVVVIESELDNLSIEELELEAIKVLRETRAAVVAKTEEFHRVSRELLDAKNAEKEAASVLRQALGL